MPLVESKSSAVADGQSIKSIHAATVPPRSSPSKAWRKPWTYLGFHKGYNVPLFIIFGGAMLGFCLAKIPSLDVPGYWASQAAPGEWYWYRTGIYRIGITLHLASVVPGGLLMILQFVPIVRHKLIVFHRLNGYTVITLMLLANVSGLMIVRHAFGGELSTQGAAGVLAIITTISMAMAWYNIKMLQIDQHRAWMLRMALYMGTIITTRLIVFLAALIVSRIGTYKALMTCGELLSLIDEAEVFDTYPLCATINANSRVVADGHAVAVQADFGGGLQGVSASLRLPFGMALWIALFIHAIGVEIYLALTPREAQRLRMVSYQRQLDAGHKNPGSAGLVLEKFGDADPWQKSSGAAERGCE